MDKLEILLPIALVVIAFILKVFMDRSATAPLLIRSLYELPVDILFLSLSFSTAAIITTQSLAGKGLLYLFLLFIATLVVVVAWRRSILLFENDRKGWSAILFVVNAAGSGYCLSKAISLLIGAPE